MDVEFHELELKYAELRIVSPASQARLLGSLATQGQHSPVLVVASDATPGRHVLIDGYRRVQALRHLGRDVVWALVLELSELEAVAWCHRMQGSRRRSALEEAWLLQHLQQAHGLGQRELARRLGRSPSWVSRHLALLRVLPASVQAQIRAGEVPPQAATKHLVPLARANSEACERLVQGLAGERVSVRQLGRLYAAWRGGDAERRERIVSQPRLFLKADAAVDASSLPPLEASILKDLEMLEAICARARRRLRERSEERAGPLPQALRIAWKPAQRSFEALSKTLEVATRSEQRKKQRDAGRGAAQHHPAPAA